MLAHGKSTVVSARPARTPKKRSFPDDEMYDYSSAYAAHKSSSNKSESSSTKKGRPEAPPAAPSAAAYVHIDAPRRSRTGRFEKNIESSSSSGWPDDTSVNLSGAKNADSIAITTSSAVKIDTHILAEVATASLNRSPRGSQVEKTNQETAKQSKRNSESLADRFYERSYSPLPVAKRGKYIKKVDRVGTVEVADDISNEAICAAVPAGVANKKGKYIKKAERIALAEKESAEAVATRGSLGSQLVENRAATFESKTPPVLKKKGKYMKIADRLATPVLDGGTATYIASPIRHATLHSPIMKKSKYIKKADRIAMAENVAVAVSIASPVNPKDVPSPVTKEGIYVTEFKHAAVAVALPAQHEEVAYPTFAEAGPAAKKGKYTKKADKITVTESMSTAQPTSAYAPVIKKKKNNYVKTADRIAMAQKGALTNTSPVISAEIIEEFLPAGAYERTPPPFAKKGKDIKKADQVAIVEQETAAVSSNQLPRAVEDAIAVQSIGERDLDLGPPMPPLLTVETNFKMKKGYYYDFVSTPARSVRKFQSCLLEFDERVSPLLDSGSKMSRSFVLQRALSIEELNDNSWLSSSLIDLVFARFARNYDAVDFLPVDFAVMLTLPSSNLSELLQATDILGRRLGYERSRPMLLLYNSKNIHWILIKVQFVPEPELQLYEPMGQPFNKKRGMSYRIVPRDVVRWLDTCCPLSDKQSWLSRAVSAITSQQQFTSFDCGVACLLYAEKCGQGQSYAEIDNSTSQQDITGFRKHLQNFVSQLQFGGAPPSF